MPFEYTVLVLLVIGALLIVAGAVWGPETKDVDFSEEDSKEALEEAPRTEEERVPESWPDGSRTARGVERSAPERPRGGS